MDNPPLTAEKDFCFSPLSDLSKSKRDLVEGWYKRLAISSGEKLTETLRTKVENTLAGLTVETFDELLRARDADSCSILFRMSAHGGIWIYDVPNRLALLIIERLMGNCETQLNGVHELTKVEEVVLKQFVTTFLKVFVRLWVVPGMLKPEILRVEQHLDRTKLQSPSDVFQVAAISVTLKEETGVVRLAAPIAEVDILVSNPTEEKVEPGFDPTLISMTSALATVPIPVAVRWQSVKMQLSQIEALEVGDVLLLDKKKCQSVSLWFGNRLKGYGQLNRTSEKSLISITSYVE